MKNWYSDWSIHRTEVYMSLADTLEHAIRSGRFVPGAQLPTHRDLSKRLGVAVSTVTRAYAEARRRGLINGAVGRGTFVLGTNKDDEAGHTREGMRPFERLYLPLMQREDAINLSLNEPLPNGSGERIRKALAAVIDKASLDDLIHYQPPQGQLEHRLAGVTWLRDLGVEVSTDEIFAVSGVQTALMAIFLGLARPGDTVLTEELTWPGALSIGRLTGIRLVPVPIDNEGMLPEAFDAACQTFRPRFVYTMPTLHNPTTATASLSRRQDIARIARAQNLFIVEDDAYGFLVEPRATSYWELARDITLYVTSLSKSIAPSLRVGFMAVPPQLHKTLRASMRVTTVMASPVLLEIAAQMINSGAAREAAQFQSAAARKRQMLASSILGNNGSETTALHFWLRIKPEVNNNVFVAEALANGVAVTPGDAFIVLPGQEPGGVRLCLCAEPSEARLELALHKLAKIIHTKRTAALPIV